MCVSYGLRKDAEGFVVTWQCKVLFKIICSVDSSGGCILQSHIYVS